MWKTVSQAKDYVSRGGLCGFLLGCFEKQRQALICVRAPLSGCSPSGSAGPGRLCSAQWLSSQTSPTRPESEGVMKHRETFREAFSLAGIVLFLPGGGGGNRFTPESTTSLLRGLPVFTQVNADHRGANLDDTSITNSIQV